MRDIADPLQTWLRGTEPLALATVIDVAGSAPRPVGTIMAIAADGRLLGNVSAGCVESAVVSLAHSVLSESREASVVTFGISDDQALEVGLTCGGTIRVLVTVPTAQDRRTLVRGLQLLAAGEPFSLCVGLRAPARPGALRLLTADGAVGSTGSAELDRRLDDLAATPGASGADAHHRGVFSDLAATVLVVPYATAPRLLIFGANDVAVALAQLGRILGYRVTVCDARAAFVSPERFADAAEVVVQWPHHYLETTEVDEHTAVCVLTHDPKFDIPVLCAALRSRAGYIGLMGSRRTQQDRRERLLAEGVEESALARLHGPIGLDLGGRAPAETAVAIAAEIVASRCKGSGRPLRDTAGPVHRGAVTP